MLKTDRDIISSKFFYSLAVFDIHMQSSGVKFVVVKGFKSPDELNTLKTCHKIQLDNLTDPGLQRNLPVCLEN